MEPEKTRWAGGERACAHPIKKECGLIFSKVDRDREDGCIGGPVPLKNRKVGEGRTIGVFGNFKLRWACLGKSWGLSTILSTRLVKQIVRQRKKEREKTH